MSFTVVIPFEANRDPFRLASLGCVQARYAELHEWPVVLGAGGQPWSKGVALDDGFARVETEGVILADADCVIDAFELGRSTFVVAAGAPWSQPHSMVYRLHRKATSRVIGGLVDPIGAPPRILCERPPHAAPPGGGIVVLSAEAYRTVGGIDNRFLGWGGEDISFARALDTLVGPGVRFDGSLWHLWHRPQMKLRGNRATPENEALASRYLDAVNDPVAMRLVIDS